MLKVESNLDTTSVHLMAKYSLGQILTFFKDVDKRYFCLARGGASCGMGPGDSLKSDTIAINTIYCASVVWQDGKNSFGINGVKNIDETMPASANLSVG